MFSSALFIFGIAFFSHCQCNDTSNIQIAYGTKVELHEPTYHVSVYTSHYDILSCGGTLIHSFYVITAAHCVDGRTTENIKIIAGTTRTDIKTRTRFIREIIMHKDYDPQSSWHNDIALLRLQTPLNLSHGVRFVALPTQHEPIPPGRTATITGYGKISENVPAIRELKEATVYTVPLGPCRQVITRIQYVLYDETMCAYDPFNKSGICVGDAGGPLVFEGKLIGILSWAKSCESFTIPTVFTRVAAYINWITKIITSKYPNEIFIHYENLHYENFSKILD